jgi:hypothetical protein
MFGHAMELYLRCLIYRIVVNAAIDRTASTLLWSLDGVPQSSLPFGRNFARPNCDRCAVSHHIAVLVDLYVWTIQRAHEGTVRPLQGHQH